MGFSVNVIVSCGANEGGNLGGNCRRLWALRGTA